MIDAGHGGRRSVSGNILLRFAAIYGAGAILGMGTYYGYRFYCESNNSGFLKGTIRMSDNPCAMLTARRRNGKRFESVRC